MVEKRNFESCYILCQSEDNRRFWLLDPGKKHEPSGFRGEKNKRGHLHSLVRGSGSRPLLTLLQHFSRNNKWETRNPDALGLTLFPEGAFEEATGAWHLFLGSAEKEGEELSSPEEPSSSWHLVPSLLSHRTKP